MGRWVTMTILELGNLPAALVSQAFEEEKLSNFCM